MNKLDDFTTKALSKIENAARGTNAASEGDYVKDELLYCGKCNAPKETILKNPGPFYMKKVNVCCNCIKLEKEKETKKIREKKIKNAISEYFGKREIWAFERDEAAQSTPSRICRRYVDKFQQFKAKGNGLLLHGANGTGKSCYADAIAYELIKAGYSVKRIDVLMLCSSVNNDVVGFDFLPSLVSSDIVVIDGIAKEISNVKNANLIYSIIETLKNSNVPMIITTTLPLSTLKSEAELKKIKREGYSAAFTSVLACTFPVACTQAFLTEAIKRNYYEMSELLND